MIRYLAISALCLFAAPAYARDGWADGRPRVCAETDKRCVEWIENVKQPDNGISCCAFADAYVTDDFEVKNGQFYAITTLDYPGLPKGTRIAIPNNKINDARREGGNPSGHSVTFGVIDDSGFTTFCYFSGTLG